MNTEQTKLYLDEEGLRRFWADTKAYLRTLVTARKRDGAFHPDRSYQDLVKSIQYSNPVIPSLRVVDGTVSFECQLCSFIDGVFTFRATPEFTETDGYMTGAGIREFKYGPSGFVDTSRNVSVQNISIDTMEIGD